MKKKSTGIICSLLLAGVFFNSFSANGQSATDTLNRNEVYNQAFNGIYRQNAPPLFFGNEYGGPEKTLLVADINPNVVLFSSKKSRFFFLFSPRVYLRLFSAYHSPVRSPSYMPGATMFTRLNNDAANPRFISLSYSHHSNGQEGSTLDANGDFNRTDGKFTTNFYRLDYYWGKKAASVTQSSSQFASIGIELHAGLFKTGYSKELTGKYGFVRTNGSWTYDIMKDKSGKADSYASHQRVRFDFTYILDKVYNYNIANINKRLNASFKYYYQFGFMENSALTATIGYRGQDPYNIYFEDSYPYFAVGVAAGISFKKSKCN
ncbi:hypothetical protein [Mucilaginibacter sp. HD30]